MQVLILAPIPPKKHPLHLAMKKALVKKPVYGRGVVPLSDTSKVRTPLDGSPLGTVCEHLAGFTGRGSGARDFSVINCFSPFRRGAEGPQSAPHPVGWADLTSDSDRVHRAWISRLHKNSSSSHSKARKSDRATCLPSWLSKGSTMGHDLTALFRSCHSEELTCGGGLLTIYGMNRSLPDLRGAIMKQRDMFDEH
jgi:hypothetical protein